MTNEKAIKFAKALLIFFAIAGVVIFLFAAFVLPRVAETASAEGAKARERLEIVWPGYMQLPELDRAVLGGLAMTCRLHENPEAVYTRDQVTACLVRGLMSDDPMLPKGVDKMAAAQAFERLTKQAQ